MLYQILTFLLEVLVTLVGGACLLRMVMRWRRMGFGNPVGQFVQALSDWIVLPLQRLLPPKDKLDAASLLAVWLLKLLQLLIIMAMAGSQRWSILPLLGLLGVARLALSVATAVVIVAAVLSWMQQRTAVTDVFNRLSEPLLAPLRRLIPLIGGIDLSPLALLVVLQVLGIVLSALQTQLFGSVAMIAG